MFSSSFIIGGKMPVKSKPTNPRTIDRRNFIRKSSITCCLACMPFAADTLFAEEKKDAKKKTGANPSELVANCGLYCGACDIYQKRILKSGKELKKILDGYNFKEIAKQVPGLQDYEAFERVLNMMIAFFGQCPGCKKGGGDPRCEIRICSNQKKYATCAECPSMPCEKLKKVDSTEFLKDIKKMGLKKWAQKQNEKVEKGFWYSEYLLEKRSKTKS